MEAATTHAPVAQQGREPGWRQAAMQHKIGPLPVPVYLAIAAITILAAVNGRLPNDMIGGFAVLMLAGFLLGEIGSRIPVLKHVGGSAILCLFVPSALVGYGLLDPGIKSAVTTTMKTANLQYLYIAGLVAGSILGMSYRVLVQGFMRMFVPLLVGTAAAIGAGLAVGLLFGYTPKHTFFFIVIPILGGRHRRRHPAALDRLLGNPRPAAGRTDRGAGAGGPGRQRGGDPGQRRAALARREKAPPHRQRHAGQVRQRRRAAGGKPRP